MPPADTLIAESLDQHRPYLWSLCYRLCGTSADADDLVQGTLVKAMEHPPQRPGPLRPWLTRVAINLSRDLLRQRRRTRYPGPWLPGVLETPPEEELAQIREPAATDARYDLMESVSLAFLVALEALTPAQRSVLILRDVFDQSVEEVAQTLGITEANVKVIHHRARTAMAAYDADRQAPSAALIERTQAALVQFLTALSTSDAPAAQQALSSTVRLVSDGGGEYFAAQKPIAGPPAVVDFLLRLSEQRGPPSELDIRPINGLPALVASYAPPLKKGHSPRFVMGVQLDGSGQIQSIYTVLATRKLAGLRPSAEGTAAV